jgi:hypothetical protein
MVKSGKNIKPKGSTGADGIKNGDPIKGPFHFLF